MLRELIRKDIRVCRLPILAGIVLLLAPYAVVGVVVPRMPLWAESTPASAWAVLLGTACYFSLACAQPALAMISGSIIAAERADRSSEFLAYLPLSRSQILAGKLAVLLGAVLATWGMYLVVKLIAVMLSGDTLAWQTLTADIISPGRLACIALLAVGAGWCGSALLGNTGPAVALGFLSPLCLHALLMLLQYLTGWPSILELPSIYFSTSATLGALLFLAGSVSYLRRVEP